MGITTQGGDQQHYVETVNILCKYHMYPNIYNIYTYIYHMYILYIYIYVYIIYVNRRYDPTNIPIIFVNNGWQWMTGGGLHVAYSLRIQTLGG